MKESLLEILSCPESGEPLELKDPKGSGDEITEGRLVSPSGRSWTIRKGIPRFVDSDRYVSNFSLEWTVHKKTQLDSISSQRSFETFKERIGFTSEEIKGRRVLDAGVGMGRYSDIALNLGGEVVGADLSLAVESAHANLGENPRFNVVQADIFHLPFKKESFDYIFSMGVLHHTPDCKKAFLSLLPLLKKGGEIAIWVYAWQGFHSIRSNFWRFFTTKIPPRTLYGIIKTLLPLWDAGLRIPLLGKAFKIIPTSGHELKEWRVLDTFDWYSARYQSKHRWEEVEGWFREAGLTDIRRLNYPVAVRGRKP